MGNCLVTKLKDVVVNPSLCKLGELQIVNHKRNTDVGPMYVRFADGTVLRSTGGLRFKMYEQGEYLTEYTCADSTSHTIYFSDDDGYFFISSKYSSIIYFNSDNIGIEINLADLKACASLRQFSTVAPYTYGDIANLSELPLERLNIRNAHGVYGNLSDISEKTNITVLKLDGSQISGQLEDLAKLTSLTEFNFYSTGITGTIEGFVAGQILNGRSSASNISAPFLTSFATFGGTLYNIMDNSYISWESNSKITVMSASRVIAKGATQEEIAAWEQAGKTVFIVP